MTQSDFNFVQPSVGESEDLVVPSLPKKYITLLIISLLCCAMAQNFSPVC